MPCVRPCQHLGRRLGLASIGASLSDSESSLPIVPLPSSSTPATKITTPSPSLRTVTAGNGSYVLMLICCISFLLDNILHVPFMKELYLYHSQPQWYQFVTHMFCHGSLEHLSSNLFQLCVFGRFVEDTEGPWGAIFIFLVCGVGAALASVFLLPASSVGVGASGAIFGLFSASVLLRILGQGVNLKNLLEAVVLGQWVVRTVMDEMQHQVIGGLSSQGMRIAHVAHLGGALCGVLLVLALSKLPEIGAGGKEA